MNSLQKEMKKNNNKFRQWWIEHDIGEWIRRIILLPIWIGVELTEVYKKKSYAKNRERMEKEGFSTEKAKKLFNKYIQKFGYINDEGNFEIQVMSSSYENTLRFDLIWNRIKNKHHRMWISRFYNECADYIEKEYTIEGFTKEVMQTYDTKWIIFTPNK